MSGSGLTTGFLAQRKVTRTAAMLIGLAAGAAVMPVILSIPATAQTASGTTAQSQPNPWQSTPAKPAPAKPAQGQPASSQPNPWQSAPGSAATGKPAIGQPAPNQPASGQPAFPSREEAEVSTCPPVTIRPGAASYAFNAPGTEGAMGLRYQATVGRLARECHIVAGNLHMKVGVHGRLILGPMGGPGKVEIPLRIALVQEGPTPVTHWTRIERIPVTIPENAAHVNFTHVEEAVVVPMPKGAEIDYYVVYVGFDAIGDEEPKKGKARRRAQTE